MSADADAALHRKQYDGPQRYLFAQRPQIGTAVLLGDGRRVAEPGEAGPLAVEEKPDGARPPSPGGTEPEGRHQEIIRHQVSGG